MGREVRQGHLATHLDSLCDWSRMHFVTSTAALDKGIGGRGGEGGEQWSEATMGTPGASVILAVDAPEVRRSMVEVHVSAFGWRFQASADHPGTPNHLN